GLGLGAYLSELVVRGNFPLAFIPAIVFALSALISFATGTSWGTFGIMIPLVMPIAVGLARAKGLDPGALVNSSMICTAGVVGGAVFGDHASPISDTTILSSTGAGCPHLEHVATQMPYAVFVAVSSLIGFFFGGLFMNMIVAWIVFAVVLALGLVLLPGTVKSE
ncbi:MAG TPA: sodium:proton antiporter, partial [Treponema sp.]|nr:sodium:proton antiporter [Treponema sp.]